MRDKYFKILQDKIQQRSPGWIFQQGAKYFKVLLSALLGRPLTGPISCVVLLTYRCNHSCRMCDFPTRVRPDRAEMSTGEVKTLLDEMADLGGSGVSFYGGEPLLRPDLPELVSYANRLGFVIHVNSNGMLLTPQMSEKLIRAGTSLITVSLDGSMEKTNDRQRGLDGAFASTTAAIRDFHRVRQKLAARTRMAVATTITPENINEIGGLLRLVYDLGADSYTVFEAQPLASIANRFGSEDQQKLLQVNRELLRLKREYRSFLDNSKPYLKLVVKILSGETARLKCFAPYTDLFVDPYGNTYPCNYFLGLNQPSGNYRPGHLRSIWYSREFRAYRKSLAGCARCNYLCHRELSLIFNRLWPLPKPELSLASIGYR